MKKIMFNDRYGLTKAVLDGRKTMTRRIIPPIEIDWNRRGKVTLPVSCFRYGILFMDASAILEQDFEYPAPAKYQPKYNAGEVVAVAQAYRDAINPLDWVNTLIYKNDPGWTNKMFVGADLMPHHIFINAVRVERLQDISDEECLKEGISKSSAPGQYYVDGLQRPMHNDGVLRSFTSPRDAFAALIDKVSGKGTWESNPWVFVYEFELVKED